MSGGSDEAPVRLGTDRAPPRSVAATRRIALWSGPRNISTAMMRAWEARGDTAVVDEPFYAHYLDRTQRDHPGAAEVTAHHETDWRRVVDSLLGPVPGDRPILYQKQMAHHLLPDIERNWLDAMTHAFLIRRPASMLASLAKVIAEPTIEETGLPQQIEIFERERRRLDRVPPVIDADDVLADPAGVLAALCRRLDVPWTERMLHWPAGPRATDGIWAKHWYDSVERSTCFAPPRREQSNPPAHLHTLCATCTDLYERLAAHKLTAN